MKISDRSLYILVQMYEHDQAMVLPSCRAVGVLVSTEDARQLALRAVRGAIAVSLRGSDAPQLGASVVAGVVAALSRALLPPMAQAAKGMRGDGGVSAFSWLSASLSSAAEVAQVGALHSMVPNVVRNSNMLTDNNRTSV